MGLFDELGKLSLHIHRGPCSTWPLRSLKRQVWWWWLGHASVARADIDLLNPGCKYVPVGASASVVKNPGWPGSVDIFEEVLLFLVLALFSRLVRLPVRILPVRWLDFISKVGVSSCC